MGNCLSSSHETHSTRDLFDEWGPTAIKSGDVYATHIYCCNSSLNDYSKMGKSECVNIMSDTELGDFSKKCNTYYNWLLHNKGQIADRSAFHRFISSGRIWILHAVHESHCSTNPNGTAAFNGLEIWFKTLLEVYENNIYNPNQLQVNQSITMVPKQVNYKKTEEKIRVETKDLIALFPQTPDSDPKTTTIAHSPYLEYE